MWMFLFLFSLKMEEVMLECVKEKSRLRVKIISPGYLNSANCRFPRNIREEGKKYSVPKSAISLISGRAGKYFYIIKKSEIKVLDEEFKVDKIYEEEGDICIVCMDQPYDMVIVPCGHYCLCSECTHAIRSGLDPRCPICRGDIKNAVTRDKIE